MKQVYASIPSLVTKIKVSFDAAILQQFVQRWLQHLCAAGRKTPDEARALMKAEPGIIVQDDPHNNVYPMPLFTSDTEGTAVVNHDATF